MNFFRSLVNGRSDYSPKCKKILEQVGNIPIQNAVLRRHPINSIITGTLNFLNIKSQPFDKLFHLSLIFTLTNGQRVVVEKNEVINIDTNPTNQAGSEFMDLKGFNGNTINEILKKTQSFMGGKFFPYSAYDNNCQSFILSILKSNKVDNPENTNWIKQNSEQLFSSMPQLRKLANTVTDIAGRFDVVRQGGEIKMTKRSNGMEGQEIIDILRHHCKNFNGLYMKDLLPKRLKKGWYIVNMQSSTDGNGTHWCAFKNSNPAIWFDSFGVIPPLDVLARTNYSLLYSSEQIQDLQSSCCGWYSIACILYDNPKVPADKSLDNFIQKFSTNTKLNDKILNKLLKAKKVNGHLFL